MALVVSTHQGPLRRAKAPLPKISLELLSSSGKSCRQAVPWWAHTTELILSGVELCAIHACRTDNCRALFLAIQDFACNHTHGGAYCLACKAFPNRQGALHIGSLTYPCIPIAAPEALEGLYLHMSVL